MNTKEHKDRHAVLHKALDELVADYIENTGNGLEDSSVMDLIAWSHKQTISPDDNSIPIGE